MNDSFQIERQLKDLIIQNDISTFTSLIASSSLSASLAHELVVVAAKVGRVEQLTMLLDLLDGIADLDDATERKFLDACAAAVRYNHFDALRLLVDRGASIGTAMGFLQMSSRRRDDRISLLLLDAGAPLDQLAPTDLLNLVVCSRSVAVLTRLLARNVDFSALRDTYGYTLCHRLIRNVGSVSDGVGAQLVTLAIDVAGVDINAVDQRGATALHYAALSRNAWAIRLLVAHGADVDRQSLEGVTALNWLCDNHRDDGPCAELLLALGANVGVVSHGVRQPTALHLVAEHNLFAALCACLAAGGDLDQPKNSHGETPRDLATRKRVPLPSAAEIAASRARIAKIRFDLVRYRALEICVGLQPLDLDALRLCEIMAQACGALGSLIAFHQWWAIAITVKHFNGGQSV